MDTNGRKVEITEVIEEMKKWVGLKWVMSKDLKTIRCCPSGKEDYYRLKDWYYQRMRGWFHAIHNYGGVKVIMGAKEKRERHEIKMILEDEERTDSGYGGGEGGEKEKKEKTKKINKVFIRIHNIPLGTRKEKVVAMMEKSLDTEIVTQWEGRINEGTMDLVMEMAKEPEPERVLKVFKSRNGDTIFMERTEWVKQVEEQGEGKLIRKAPAEAGVIL